MGEQTPLPPRLRDLLPGAARSIGLDRAPEVARIWQRWGQIVGGDIAAHAQPTSLRDGVLRVRVSSAVWATEIGYLAPRIAAEVNAAVRSQVVKEVRVWTGPDPREPARNTPAVTPATPDRAPRRDDPIEALAAARDAWSRRLRTSRRGSL